LQPNKYRTFPQQKWKYESEKGAGKLRKSKESTNSNSNRGSGGGGGGGGGNDGGDDDEDGDFLNKWAITADSSNLALLPVISPLSVVMTIQVPRKAGTSWIS
jgi:hypothetical protein